ncbi:hypothetical protein Taro_000568 [Colocasia esculenta]|uniref:Uncharacterized protein n=1 Tax=Colocasia esculenta TaxID=4460 RepID=A0A843T8E3_COLES|nr:hypothetical protein [Colocasia esculenta]
MLDEERRPWRRGIREEKAGPSSNPCSSCSNPRRSNESKGHNFFKGSVDTPHTGVDTMLQTPIQKMKKWSSSVDTRSSQVDTRPSSQPGQCVDTKPDGVDTRDFSQKACFTVFTSVSTRDEVVSTLETCPREVGLLVRDSVSTLDQVRCNKPGHIKGECSENKKEKHKKIHKFKKPKAMVATWSDEDSSEKEEEEKSSSSESEEICFMTNSSDGKPSPARPGKNLGRFRAWPGPARPARLPRPSASPPPRPRLGLPVPLPRPASPPASASPRPRLGPRPASARTLATSASPRPHLGQCPRRLGLLAPPPRPPPPPASASPRPRLSPRPARLGLPVPPASHAARPRPGRPGPGPGLKN